MKEARFAWSIQWFIKIIKQYNWFFHLLVFIFFQFIFYQFDGSKIWMIFNLNETGEKGVELLHWVFSRFQPYQTTELNFVTFFWFIILTLHGISFMRIILKRNIN